MNVVILVYIIIVPVLINYIITFANEGNIGNLKVQYYFFNHITFTGLIAQFVFAHL